MDLSDTVRLLGDLLGQVVSAEESPQLFETEEVVRALAKARRSGETQAGAQLAAEVATLAPDAARGVASAFTLYFDLVNVAEEDYRVQALRQRQRDLHPNPGSESIADAIGQLKQHGVTPDQMATLLNQLHVELVLTAHPTEAKRRTILSKLLRVSQDLHRLDDCDLLPHERDDVLAALRAEMTLQLQLAQRSEPGGARENRLSLHLWHRRGGRARVRRLPPAGQSDRLSFSTSGCSQAAAVPPANAVILRPLAAVTAPGSSAAFRKALRGDRASLPTRQGG